MSENDFQNLSVVVAFLAITVSAFGVWLAVRIINRHERWAINLTTYLLTASVLSAAAYFCIPRIRP